MYDSKNNSGWLAVGMKNFRKREKINKAILSTDVDNNIPIANTSAQYSDVSAKKDVELLKSTKVEPSNMSTIKEKLKLTSSYRTKMITESSIDLLEWFPYFFTCPALVSSTFDLTFCGLHL